MFPLSLPTIPALQWPCTSCVSVLSVAPHKAPLLSGCTRKRLAASVALAPLKPQEMSLPPSSGVSAEGVTIYTGHCGANPVSVYCHGSGESGLPNPSASLARCWVRVYKLLRHCILQRAPSCAAVPGAEPLLCPPSVLWAELCFPTGALIPVSSPFLVPLSPAHPSPNQSLCGVVSLPTLTTPQVQALFPLLPSPFL